MEIHLSIKLLISLRIVLIPTKCRQENAKARSVSAFQKSEPDQAASLQQLNIYILIQKGIYCRNHSKIDGVSFSRKGTRKIISSQ